MRVTPDAELRALVIADDDTETEACVKRRPLHLLSLATVDYPLALEEVNEGTTNALALASADSA